MFEINKINTRTSLKCRKELNILHAVTTQRSTVWCSGKHVSMHYLAMPHTNLREHFYRCWCNLPPAVILLFQERQCYCCTCKHLSFPHCTPIILSLAAKRTTFPLALIAFAGTWSAFPSSNANFNLVKLRPPKFRLSMVN